MKRGHVRKCASLLAFAMCLLAAGCTGVGPNVIRNGRPIYNDAIVATNNEQLLAMIVRMRYEEPAGLLSVASVTANVRVQASVGGEFGYGPEDYFSGNLVPLRAGALYEDNPTISYTPVQGQEFLRQGFSPLPLDLTVLLLNVLGGSPDVMTLLIKEINGVANPDLLGDGFTPVDARFGQIVELMTSLHRLGRLLWVEKDGKPPSFALVLRSEAGGDAAPIAELSELLGISPPPVARGLVTLPVILGIGRQGGDTVVIRTRAIFELFQIAAASVEVPDAHLESGLAPPLPPGGPATEQIRIRRSASRPGDTLVAVRHHGWWFWIDSTDARSKATFRMLEAIMTARMADATGRDQGVPVLTVPVSR